MAKQSDEAFLAGRQRWRMRMQHNFLVRTERRGQEREIAVRQLGQLCRDGKTIYYVFPVGGKYRESADPYDLVK